MIIGLTGKARSGKDTIADIITKLYGYEHYWFSKPMKEACRTIFGWNDAHLYGDLKEVVDERYGTSPRHALQTLGTEWGRGHIRESIWLDVARSHIEKGNVVVSDVRFDNEAELIKELGGIVIQVERGDAPDVLDHASEKGVHFHLVDYLVQNDGTISELEDKVCDILDSVSS